jgi:HemY protein
MKRLIIFLIVLFIAVVIGLMVHFDPGYVLLAYGHWTVEMPLWFALLTVIIIFLLCHYAVRLWIAIKKSGGHWHSWRARKKTQKAHTLTGRGVLFLAEAHWSKAEKLLIQGVESSEVPVINYLGAAIAAQKVCAYERRDKYISKAHKIAPEEEIAVGLTQAQLQLQHNQLESALAVLRHLYELEPSHPYVLQLLKDLYLKLKDWQHLLQLLPMLRKQKALNKEESLVLEIKIYKQQLMAAADDATKLREIWRNIPRYLRKESELAELFNPKPSA